MSKASQIASICVSPQKARRYERRALNSLGCLYLSGDSGGIVLNVSEGGLAVYSSLIPGLHAMPSLRFQLPGSSDWLKARGQVVWTSETKHEAGIQFVDLPDQVRKRIRQWISPSHCPDNSAVTSAAEARASLAVVPPVRADGSSEAEGQLSAASPGGSDSLERELRALFGRRTSVSAPTALSGKRTRRGVVALVSTLAVLSLVIGLVAGGGKLNGLFGSAANATPSSPAAPSDSAHETNNAPSRASGRVPASAATREAPTQKTRVTVTSQVYVPGSDQRVRNAKAQNLQIGRIDYRVDPHYPSQAIREGIEGTVQLRASIGAAGGVRSVSVMSGPPLLTPSAVDAVRAWHYTPTLLDGKPIETEANIAIVFWLPADFKPNWPRH